MARIIRLKNGAAESMVNVAIVFENFKSLWLEHPDAREEIVRIAEHPDHEISANNRKVIMDSGLVSNGTMHSVVRNVVLSSIDENGKLVNPW
jgi:hypothetical protein